MWKKYANSDDLPGDVKEKLKKLEGRVYRLKACDQRDA